MGKRGACAWQQQKQAGYAQKDKADCQDQARTFSQFRVERDATVSAFFQLQTPGLLDQVPSFPKV